MVVFAYGLITILFRLRRWRRLQTQDNWLPSYNQFSLFRVDLIILLLSTAGCGRTHLTYMLKACEFQSLGKLRRKYYCTFFKHWISALTFSNFRETKMERLYSSEFHVSTRKQKEKHPAWRLWAPRLERIHYSWHLSWTLRLPSKLSGFICRPTKDPAIPHELYKFLEQRHLLTAKKPLDEKTMKGKAKLVTAESVYLWHHKRR